jgi:hypothetical protein
MFKGFLCIGSLRLAGSFFLSLKFLLHTFEGWRENMTGGVWCVAMVAGCNLSFTDGAVYNNPFKTGVLLLPPGS